VPVPAELRLLREVCHLMLMEEVPHLLLVGLPAVELEAPLQSLEDLQTQMSAEVLA
jgi:hypothetical protein